MKKSISIMLFFIVAINSYSQKIELPDTTVVKGTIVNIPIKINNLFYLVAADIMISYDSTILEALEPSLPIYLVDNGFDYSFNIHQAGIYRLYIAGIKQFYYDEGILAFLNFRVIGNEGESAMLEGIQFDINEIARLDNFQYGKITITNQMVDDISIPNAFTPNNDGYNDYFEVPFPEKDIIGINIFNQDGELVYSSEERIKWDGTANGRLLPQATYFYFLQVNGNRINGCIRLIR